MDTLIEQIVGDEDRVSLDSDNAVITVDDAARIGAALSSSTTSELVLNFHDIPPAAATVFASALRASHICVLEISCMR